MQDDVQGTPLLLQLLENLRDSKKQEGMIMTYHHLVVIVEWFIYVFRENGNLPENIK